VKLLLDAGGLIKLNRAGVLRQVVHVFPSFTPQKVYDEVVTKGKEGSYADAEEIEEIVNSGAISVLAAPSLEPELPSLGSGEKAVLGLLPQVEGAIVVSDDRRFLAHLEEEDIPFLVPAALIVEMVRGRHLTKEDAVAALERLRPQTPEGTFKRAMQDLNEAEEESEEAVVRRATADEE
jgi:hypothetical protein